LLFNAEKSTQENPAIRISGLPGTSHSAPYAVTLNYLSEYYAA
jgi:hypothetical protein